MRRAKCTQVIMKEVEKEGVELTMMIRGPVAEWGILLPACSAEPPGIHFAHVAEANDSHDEVLHGW